MAILSLAFLSAEVPAGRQEASAFLARATFGPTEEGIDHLIGLGSYDEWIEEQFALPPTFHMDWILSHARGVNGVGDLADHPGQWDRYSDALGTMQLHAWWDIVVHSDDQLRQRVAFALSELFVISKYGPLLNFPDARISFYDTLVRHAFDNFETLLRAVTYHPAMGKYLSYLGNARAGVFGAHPDENYAREVMQLFTIGLYRLRPDGTKVLDENGSPIHTYSQEDVTEMARVFTGLSDDNGHIEAEAAFSSHHSRTAPMRPFSGYHDRGSKRILGHTLPAGQGTRRDIRQALRILVRHPNTAPFVARHLIQRLVTSNPSPQYIERVSRVFENNGEGVRGDMKAVIRAVLLDPEALHGRREFPETFGKLREPLLYISHLLRAFHARNGYHYLEQEGKRLYRYRSFNLEETGFLKQEGPLSALTVFNYFSPEDAPTALRKRGLAAPEMTVYGKQGIDDVLMGIIHKNGFIYELMDLHADLRIGKIERWMKRKQFRRALSYLNTLLCAGTLSTESEQTILDYLERVASRKSPEKLARHLIGLVITSPDYALQR